MAPPPPSLTILTQTCQHTLPPVCCTAEYRISVYGRKPVEWDTLAAWVVQNRLHSDNNMWLIQVRSSGGAAPGCGVCACVCLNKSALRQQRVADPGAVALCGGVMGVGMGDDRMKALWWGVRWCCTVPTAPSLPLTTALPLLPQVPRLYNVYKEQGIIETFEQVGEGRGLSLNIKR